MSDELLPIEPLDRELWSDFTDEQFARLNDNIVWVLLHATDIHGEPLTIEERNMLIARHNESVRTPEA
jgi:hypothetical protein